MDASMHPYRGTVDLERVIDLLLTSRVIMDGDPWPPVAAIRRYLAAQSCGCAEVGLWEDAAGRLLACTILLDACMLFTALHPAAQDEALETEVIAWGQARVGEQARVCGETAALYVPVRDDDPQRLALLSRLGYTATAWSNERMARSLALPIAPVSLPAGFALRSFVDEPDLAAVPALQHEAFAEAALDDGDSWAPLRDPADHPDLDLVVVAPDGTLAAFGVGSMSHEENQRSHRPIGWIERLGTGLRYRRQGLGRALLLALLHRLRAHGIVVALLTTASTNSAAQRLFETCGFVRWYQILWRYRENGG
jgi:ribosomal protein S18 acetylase RimI-like enzyme